jgi:hypothetical protein
VSSGDGLHVALDRAADEGLAPNVVRQHRFLDPRQGEECLELQALGVGAEDGRGGRVLYAHARDADETVALLQQADESAVLSQGDYAMLNPLPIAVAHRDPDRAPGNWHLAERGKSTTDADVPAYVTALIDVDAVRPTGTSSTDEELRAAEEVTAAIYADLTVTLGRHDFLAVGRSGNGCSILLALARLPATPETQRLLGEVFRAVKALYDTDRVKIDAHLTDPKRLGPAFGTVKRKGPPGDPLRPHRRTAVLTPREVRRLTADDLRRLRGALVARLPAPVPPPVPSPPPVPEDDFAPPPEDSLDLADLRKRIVLHRRKKRESSDPRDAELYRIYGAILDGTPLAEPGGRAKAVNAAASGLAFVLPAGAPWEVAVELLRPAVTAMDCEPEGVGYWLGPQQAQGSYDRALARRAEVEEQRRVREEAQAATRRTLLGLGRAQAPAPATPSVRPPTLSEAAALAVGAPLSAVVAAGDDQEGDGDWEVQLIRNADDKPQSCPFNVYATLTNAPAFRGTLRWNEVSKDIEVRGGPFAGVHSSVLATAAANWLHKVCKLKVEERIVERQILLVARENAYDPIAEYLDGLVWDGVERLPGYFLGQGYVTACRRSELGRDLTAHLTRLAVMFFVSAVARALRPGCQVDTMLVLEGLEGILKTSMLRALFSPWYMCTQIDLDAKDALLIPSGNWGVEVGELSSVRRSEDAVLLNFLTKVEDKFRVPYGRRLEAFPRRSVLIGTTNKFQWLTPGKGKRRYLPVRVEVIDLAAVERDRDQLWAEAVARFRGYVDGDGIEHPPARWHLVDDEVLDAYGEAEARVEDDLVHDKLHEWFYGRAPTRRPREVTLSDAVAALELSLDRAGRFTNDIAGALVKLGFQRERAGNRRVWRASDEMLAAPVAGAATGAAPSGLAAVAAAKATRGGG